MRKSLIEEKIGNPIITALKKEGYEFIGTDNTFDGDIILLFKKRRGKLINIVIVN